jgi:NADH-quinone oxidoreductase subunit J
VSFGLTAFSSAFVTQYWLEFELTTVLLVSAVVAAIAVIGVSRRTQSTAPSAPETPRG